jgi:hypothetical protein
MTYTIMFQKWWRWLFFPAVVIVSLNIENVAATFGLDKLLTTRWSIVTEIATFIQSDGALYIALFIAGGGAFAWGSYLLRKWDEGIPNPKFMATDCNQLAEFYSGAKGLLGPKWFVERSIVRSTERVNRKLAKHSISPVPLPDMTSEPSKLHVAQYLSGLAIFLQKKDIAGAQRAEQIYLRNLDTVGFVHRPLPDTEGEPPEVV